jgi:hypothetical protein
VEKEVQVVVTATPEAAEEEAPAPPPPFEPPTEVIASGLNQPRQLMYTDDGTLYIVETGRAFANPNVEVDPETVIGADFSGKITAVAPDGVQSAVLFALPSIQTQAGNTGLHGVQGLYVTDGSYWITIGEGPPRALGVFSFFRQVLEIDRETRRIVRMIDTEAAAIAANQPEPDAISSDPADLALADDGTLFIADAGCNCLWTWTEADSLQAFHLWDIDDNPVPTGVDFGPDGDVYVSFLSPFPFQAQAARIERYSRDGALKQTYSGLSFVTDVLVTDDGTIYAVEFATGFGDTGFTPDSGRVVTVSESGITPVLEGLRLPYGLAQAPDGSMVVSINAAFDTGGNGMVIKVPGQ